DACFRSQSGSSNGSSSGDRFPSPFVQPDLLNDYLARLPRRQRLQAAMATTVLRLGKLRGTSIQVGGPSPNPTTSAQIITPQLDGDSTARLKRRVLEKYRFPSVSLVLLASLFRSIREISPHHHDQDRCIVGIGVDLGIRRAETLCLQNLVSLVAADARQAELADRDQLVHLLMRQFRRRITERIDLGTIALSSLFQNFRRFSHWWVRRHMRGGYTCWYGCFDLPTPVNDLFCDTELHEVRYFGPAWTPPGFTLLVNT